jgi:hypothetical protein
MGMDFSLVIFPDPLQRRIPGQRFVIIQCEWKRLLEESLSSSSQFMA